MASPHTIFLGAASLILLAVQLMCVSGQAPCSLNDVPLQANFNLTRFLGKWYEITWISPTYQDGGDGWINYYHVYETNHFGAVNSYYSGKDPHSGECFFGGQVLLESTVHPAKLMMYSVGRKAVSDYWIMKTDYISYAVAYSCVESSGSTCTVSRSWLWGRTKSLPNPIKVETKQMWQQQCMNLTNYLDTNFIGDACVPNIPTSNTEDCNPTGGAERTMSIGYLLLIVAIFSVQDWNQLCL